MAKPMSFFRIALVLTAFVCANGTAVVAGEQKPPPPPSIDAVTGKILSEAIELLNTEKYKEAQAKIATLKLEELSPFERGKVEQILVSIAIAAEDYAAARKHIENAIASGGLNEQEISQVRYQRAQLFIQEEKWKEGAQALEEWLKTATNPNSAAYYLLAVAYYQLEDIDRALPHAKKAVEMAEKPQEGWISLLVAMYLQKEQYREALPYLEGLVAVAPTKKNYWLQLSAVYQQLEEYPKALALTQLAFDAGLLTEETDLQRLADLQMFGQVPYRCAVTMENAIQKNQIKVNDKVYEKLANCWIAAGEFEKAIVPLRQGGEMAPTGDLLVRLGEVNVHREAWGAAEAALNDGINKGKLKDLPNAQLLMAIALFNQKKYGPARTWFERLPKTGNYPQMTKGYLQLISAAQQQAQNDAPAAQQAPAAAQPQQ